MRVTRIKTRAMSKAATAAAAAQPAKKAIYQLIYKIIYTPITFGMHLENLWPEQRKYPLRKRVENWIKQKNKK
jgi:hypothetical protein